MRIRFSEAAVETSEMNRRKFKNNDERFSEKRNPVFLGIGYNLSVVYTKPGKNE